MAKDSLETQQQGPSVRIRWEKVTSENVLQTLEEVLRINWSIDETQVPHEVGVMLNGKSEEELVSVSGDVQDCIGKIIQERFSTGWLDKAGLLL